MSRPVDRLFCGSQFSDYRRDLEDQLVDEISSLSSDELRHSNDTLALIFTSKYVPSRIKLYDNDLIEGGEVEKDVSHRKDLAIFDRSTPTYKTYQRLKLKLPFDGDQKLFLMQPRKFNMNPPIYGELHQNKVVYYVDYAIDKKEPDEIQDAIQSEVDQWVKDVEWYVEQLNADIERIQDTLSRKARSEIKCRRESVDTNQQVMAELGVDTGNSQDTGYVTPKKAGD